MAKDRASTTKKVFLAAAIVFSVCAVIFLRKNLTKVRPEALVLHLVNALNLPISIENIHWAWNWSQLFGGKFNDVEFLVKWNGALFRVKTFIAIEQKDKNLRFIVKPDIFPEDTVMLKGVFAHGDLIIEKDPETLAIHGSLRVKTEKISAEISSTTAFEVQKIKMDIPDLSLVVTENQKLEFSGSVTSQIQEAQLLAGTYFKELKNLEFKNKINLFYGIEESKLNALRLEGGFSSAILGQFLKDHGIGLQKVDYDLKYPGESRIETRNLSWGPFQIGKLKILGKTNDSFSRFTLRVNHPVVILSKEPVAGKAVASGLKMNMTPNSLTGQMSLKGSGYRIAGLQKVFCIYPSQPLDPALNPQLNLDFPSIKISDQEIKAEGKITAKIFDGNFHLEKIIFRSGKPPSVFFSLGYENADLHPLAQWLGLGEVRGRLGIFLKEASFALTSLGPVPRDYDFTVHGRSGEEQLNFSVEALNDFMEMMGVKEATASNLMAGLGFSIWTFFGKTFSFLNNMDYFGFRSKTELDYTTLETFDPPDSKNHYLIYGTSFKMPLRSTVGETIRYPVVMSTESFQGWLWGRVAWIKMRQKEKEDAKPNHEKLKAGQEKCTLPW